MTPTTLRAALHERGLSIRAAAPVLGVHWCTVRDYLSGRKPITQDRADLIELRLASYDADPWRHREMQTQSARREQQG